MEQQINPYVLLTINVLLGLVSIFGGLWLRNMDATIKEARMELKAQTEKQQQAERLLHDKFSGYVAKDEFREFREEQRQNFVRLFDGIDDLKERIAQKADRATT